jgi:hypothetical protein
MKATNRIEAQNIARRVESKRLSEGPLIVPHLLNIIPLGSG